METGIFSDGIVYWHWLTLAGLLIGLEIVAPGVFLLFPGLAAAVLGLVLLGIPSLDWRLQLLLFAALAVAFIYIGRRYYGRISESEDHKGLNRRGQRHVGEVHRLAGPMTSGRGKLRVGDTDWLARLDEGRQDDLPDGASMRVVAVEGATFIVVPREEA